MKKTEVIQTITEYLTETLKENPNAESGGVSHSSLLVVYRFMPVRDYDPEDPIIPSSLVELDLVGRVSYYFITPQGGGLVTSVDGKPLQVITPQSPLGEALVGRKKGDLVNVEIRGQTRVYRILSVR